VSILLWGRVGGARGGRRRGRNFLGVPRYKLREKMGPEEVFRRLGGDRELDCMTKQEIEGGRRSYVAPSRGPGAKSERS